MCSNNYKWVDGEIATYAIWYECNVCSCLLKMNGIDRARDVEKELNEVTSPRRGWFRPWSISTEWVSECVWLQTFKCVCVALHKYEIFWRWKKTEEIERGRKRREFLFISPYDIFLSWINHEIYIFFGNTLAPYHYTLCLYVYVIDFTSSKWQRLPNLLLLLLLLLAAVMRIVCVFMCFQSVSIPLSYHSGISVGVHRKTVDRPKKTINKWRWFLLHILPYEVLALKLLADLIYSLWMKFIKWIK